jgi:hypothetical protein
MRFKLSQKGGKEDGEKEGRKEGRKEEVWVGAHHPKDLARKGY